METALIGDVPAELWTVTRNQMTVEHLPQSGSRVFPAKCDRPLLPEQPWSEWFVCGIGLRKRPGRAENIGQEG